LFIGNARKVADQNEKKRIWGVCLLRHRGEARILPHAGG
jgi:hypothetical protein